MRFGTQVRLFGRESTFELNLDGRVVEFGCLALPWLECRGSSHACLFFFAYAKLGVREYECQLIRMFYVYEI